MGSPDFEATKLSVERKWLSLLYHHCQSGFSSVHLPSHDHTHHLRVWRFACQIAKSLWSQGMKLDEPSMEKLMIAVFFHDLGMIHNQGKEHGHESRLLCEDFFHHHPELQVHSLPEILAMVEHHDEKDYSLAAKAHSPNIGAILNMADDLDAFGCIGVYRYAEIYWLRGIPVGKMPAAILPNLEKRHAHFLLHLGFLEELATLHTARYGITRDFYRDLQSEIYDNPSPALGPRTVLKELIRITETEGMGLTSLFPLTGNLKSDLYAEKFFAALKQELDN